MAKQIRVNCQDSCMMCKVIPIRLDEWSDVRSMYKNSANTKQKEWARMVLTGRVVKVACEKQHAVIWVQLV